MTLVAAPNWKSV